MANFSQRLKYLFTGRLEELETYRKQLAVAQSEIVELERMTDNQRHTITKMSGNIIGLQKALQEAQTQGDVITPDEEEKPAAVEPESQPKPVARLLYEDQVPQPNRAERRRLEREARKEGKKV